MHHMRLRWITPRTTTIRHNSPRNTHIYDRRFYMHLIHDWQFSLQHPKLREMTFSTLKFSINIASLIYRNYVLCESNLKSDIENFKPLIIGSRISTISSKFKYGVLHLTKLYHYWIKLSEALYKKNNVFCANKKNNV